MNTNDDSTIVENGSKKCNQYIKDCEAGAGRTPSVRRRK